MFTRHSAGLRSARHWLQCVALFALSGVLFPTAAPAQVADPGSVTAAHLTADPQSLQNVLRVPKSDGDLLVRLNCDAWVTPRGSILQTVCFAPDNRYSRYEYAVGLASRYARIEPARVNGRGIAVWFQYRVEFERQGGVAAVRVFPNQGQQISTYGPDYVAPQRIRDPKIAYFSNQCDRRETVWAQATISEQGTAQTVSVADGKAGPACRALLIAGIQRSRFVPAQVAGRPVRALYQEAFFFLEGSRRR